MRHHCHATGCSTPILRERLMCVSHWRMVPSSLQRAVLNAYRPGQCDDMRLSPAYLDAAKAAVVWVARLERRTPNTRLYDTMRAAQ